MAKQWQGTVFIDAPVSEVYRFLADFAHHAEWDFAATRLEQVEAGDARGVGAEWRTYEKLDSLQSDRGGKSLLHLGGAVGVTVREVRELEPNKRIAWHTYPIPRMGVTADCAFDLGGRRLKLDSLWVNLLKPGGAHSGHIHPHSVVSGTV